jgi:hypothetical protein
MHEPWGSTAAKAPTDMKVAFIAGLGRSGSTILGRILGEMTGFVYVGELYRLWERIRTGQDVCGCRRRLADCPFWSVVFADAYQGYPFEIAGRMEALIDRHTRARHFPALSWSRRRGRWAKEVQSLQDSLSTLYQTVQNVSGCRVIVDTSKQPAYGRVLSEIPGVDLYVIHLVRDPRAVAFSWLREKAHPITGVNVIKMGWPKSALIWLGNGIISEAIVSRDHRQWRYVRIRYEDFVARPRETVEFAVSWLGERESAAPFLDDHLVHLGLSHTVSGNPNRYEEGRIALTPDVEWRRRLNIGAKIGIRALCWPVMVRYGYSLSA